MISPTARSSTSAGVPTEPNHEIPRTRRPDDAPWGEDGAALIYRRALRAVPAAVGRLRREVDVALESLSVDADRRAAIALALSEAVTNATLHAYRGRDPGPIEVHVSAIRGDLLLTVTDAGLGPRPRTDSPGPGLGLAIIGSSCDEVEVSPVSSAGGTRIRAVFRRAVPVSDAGVRFARASRARRASAGLADTASSLQDALDALREDGGR